MKKGYLTVYLSLTIAIMLSLILALFQNARIGAIKMKAECAADISMNSVLAEYNRALFEKYDLLLTDCSYQTDSPSMANVEEHLRYFMKGNFETTSMGRLTGSATLTGMTCDEVSIPAYSFATDGEGAVLRRQILEYMRADPVMDRISEATANLGVLAANGFDTYDVEACAAENRERIDEMLEDAPEIETDEGETEEPIPDNPADAVEEVIEEEPALAPPVPGKTNPLWLLLWIPVIAVAYKIWREFLSDWVYDIRMLLLDFIARLRKSDQEGEIRRSESADFYDTETNVAREKSDRSKQRTWRRDFRRWLSMPDGREKFYAGYRLLLEAPGWQEHPPLGADTVREIREKWAAYYTPKEALDAVTADFHADRYAESGLPPEAIADLDKALRCIRNIHHT